MNAQLIKERIRTARERPFRAPLRVVPSRPAGSELVRVPGEKRKPSSK